ncbi:MAG: hypothetical protein ACREIA_11940 [Opitutaceae bacterium]
MLGAVLAPVAQNWSDDPRDDFPLSYYPMFISGRDNERDITHLIGIDAQGGEHILPFRLAGPGGFNQVRKQIRKGVHMGGASDLVRQVAERASRNEAYNDLVAVEVVTGVYRLDDYFEGHIEPVRRRVHARTLMEDARRR